jgi:hypothetical protein
MPCRLARSESGYSLLARTSCRCSALACYIMHARNLTISDNTAVTRERHGRWACTRFSLFSLSASCCVRLQSPCSLNISPDLTPPPPPTFIFQLTICTYSCSRLKCDAVSRKWCEQCCSNVALTSRCRAVVLRLTVTKLMKKLISLCYQKFVMFIRKSKHWTIT